MLPHVNVKSGGQEKAVWHHPDTGLNRQIRRMCEYFGYRVEKLVRTRIMNIELGDLKAGNYREVTSQEYDELMRLVKDSSNTTVIHRRDGGDR